MQRTRTDEPPVVALAFKAGLVAVPLGIVVVVMGWWGTSRSPYSWDQAAYIVSGGLLGIALTCGGGLTVIGVLAMRIVRNLAAVEARLELIATGAAYPASVQEDASSTV